MSTQPLARDATDTRPLAEISAVPTDPAPGVLRLKLGDAIVTALLDGSIDLPLTVFSRMDEPEAAALLERDFAQTPVRSALTAAGIDPASIDAVAMTLLHPDHVNGLLAPGCRSERRAGAAHGRACLLD